MKRYAGCLKVVGLVCVGTGLWFQVPTAAGDPPPPPPQVRSAPTQGDAARFYHVLSPHGTWIEVAPFGVVWQPHEVRTCPGWRPYRDSGKWIWVNNAWYWHSEYSWGSIPFHYGRWMMGSTVGWIWVPGGDWSPGWVSWRTTSTHYHWAPLPVERSAYVGVDIRAGHGLALGFHFSITDDHYVCASRREFGEVVYAGASGSDNGNTSWRVEYVRPAPVVVVPMPPPVPLFPVHVIHREDHHGDHHGDHHDRGRMSPPRRDHCAPPVIVQPPPCRPPSTGPTVRTPVPVQRSQPARTTSDRRTSRLQNIIVSRSNR